MKDERRRRRTAINVRSARRRMSTATAFQGLPRGLPAPSKALEGLGSPSNLGLPRPLKASQGLSRPLQGLARPFKAFLGLLRPSSALPAKAFRGPTAFQRRPRPSLAFFGLPKPSKVSLGLPRPSKACQGLSNASQGIPTPRKARRLPRPGRHCSSRIGRESRGPRHLHRVANADNKHQPRESTAALRLVRHIS